MSLHFLTSVPEAYTLLTRNKCVCCNVVCLQQRPWLPHKCQQWPATQPAPRTPSAAFWVSAQLLTWARGRGTKVSKRICVCVCAGVCLFTCVIVLFGCNGIFQVQMCTHTTHINTLCDDGQPQDPLLTLPAWKAQMERTQHRRINDRCVWVCVCMCNMGVLNQTSSFRKPYLFTNSVSLENCLRRQFMHALLIIYAVMLDQCCMHVNRGARGFSQVLYVYVCVCVCMCVSVYVAVSVALKSHHTDSLLR